MATRKRLKALGPEDTFVHALEQAPPEFLECREMAHQWRLTSPYRLVNTRVEDRLPRAGHSEFAERKLTCQRCGMVRADAYAISSRSGYTSLTKLGSSYQQPDGYAITGAGNTAGMRDLLNGIAYEQARTAADNRRRPARRRQQTRKAS